MQFAGNSPTSGGPAGRIDRNTTRKLVHRLTPLARTVESVDGTRPQSL
jgi:hypothetical protein